MSRVVHFEIHAENPARAIEFYTNVFNWKFRKTNAKTEYWLIITGDGVGIDGGLARREGAAPDTSVGGFVCIIDIDGIDEILLKITNTGGRITKEKKPIPGIGWVAYAQDTEENVFGIMQSDSTV